MKQFLTLFLFFHAFGSPLYAQPLLYGITNSGGASNSGVIFFYNAGTNTYTKVHDFINSPDGAYPNGKLIQASNGLLYGTTTGGGSANRGIIYSFNPATNGYAIVYEFNLAGSSPSGSLVQASSGLLYGMTTGGGSSYLGVIYSFDPVTNMYTKLKDFTGTGVPLKGVEGQSPESSLIQASDGLLYGMTGTGGTYDNGVLFSFNPVTNAYAKRKDFSGSPDGGGPTGHLFQASNGLLYGTTPGGGNSSWGTVFSFNPATNTYTKVKDFMDSPDGSNPFASLTQASDGQLYGMTTAGGANDWGTIYSLNPTTNAVTIRKDLIYAEGALPQSDLMQASNGLLYGMTARGGTYSNGVIFSFNPSTNTFMKLKEFAGPEGSIPFTNTALTEVKITSGICTTPPTFKNDGTILLDASCGKSDGNISIIPTSGTYPFSYSIDGGATYFSNQYPGYTFNNLAPGTYNLRLKDATGCESAIVEKTLIARYNRPTFKNDSTIVRDASCARNDGNISIIPTSGAPRFWYSINGGATYVTNDYAGYTFNNLVPGNYLLRLKDTTGCESETIERVVKLNCASNCTPPTFVNNGLIILDATCANNDGNINIIPTSGTAPFMYSINGGATYVAGPNAGYGFQNLPSGTYKLRLKDANGCESAIVEREVKLRCSTCTPPTFVNNGLIILDASCGKSDGNVNIIPTSGTPPFMYSINGGATYVAGPNAGYGFQNLPAGTYQLRLKDARGCQSAIVERTVRNYYNCPGVTVSTNTSEASLALSNRDVIATYPNPNTGQFKLLLQNFQSPKADVSIFDSKGTLIQKRSLNLTQNTIVDFDLKGKAGGVYYIRVSNSSGTRTIKALKQ
jgi:uncharacterized repeat protein (TIGR03803 family)